MIAFIVFKMECRPHCRILFTARTLMWTNLRLPHPSTSNATSSPGQGRKHDTNDAYIRITNPEQPIIFRGGSALRQLTDYPKSNVVLFPNGTHQQENSLAVALSSTVPYPPINDGAEQIKFRSVRGWHKKHQPSTNARLEVLRPPCRTRCPTPRRASGRSRRLGAAETEHSQL